MARLVRISTAAEAGDYLLTFRRSDDSIVELTAVLGTGSAITAHPDFLSIGRCRDVNEITDRILPALRAFASATSVEFDDA